MTKLSKVSGLLLGVAPGILLACVPPGDGVPPSAADVYFPISLSVTEDAEHLIVVNSDFDLQYAQGTIQSLDMARIRELVDEPCSTDSDCSGGEVCDTEPNETNGASPSFFCLPEGAAPCEGPGQKSSRLMAVAPGRCAFIKLEAPYDGGSPLIVDVAETSAFATQGLLLSRPCVSGDEFIPCPSGTPPEDRAQERVGETYSERLFVPIRGDSSVHYLDLTDEGQFRCGRGVEESPSAGYAHKPSHSLGCSGEFRISDGKTWGLDASGAVLAVEEPPDPRETEEDKKKDDDPRDDFRLPVEPYDLSASDDGRVLVVSHQMNGKASALLNPWLARPSLVDVLDGLSENAIGVASLPSSSLEDLGFYITYRNDARVDLLRFIDDGLLEASGPSGPSDEQLALGVTTFRPFLTNVAGSPIVLNSVGVDNRGMAVDGRRQRAALSACAATDEVCLKQALLVPLDVYVANRAPNSLLVGRTAGEDPNAKVSALPEFHNNVPLTAGPSRVVLGHVVGRDGEKLFRVFVLCFDSALIYVYDPERRVIESEIRTGRGPHSLAFDPLSALAFVGHFTDSYIGVVSLDQRHPLSFGTTVATLAQPKAPRAAE